MKLATLQPSNKPWIALMRRRVGLGRDTGRRDIRGVRDDDFALHEEHPAHAILFWNVTQ